MPELQTEQPQLNHNLEQEQEEELKRKIELEAKVQSQSKGDQQRENKKSEQGEHNQEGGGVFKKKLLGLGLFGGSLAALFLIPPPFNIIFACVLAALATVTATDFVKEMFKAMNKNHLPKSEEGDTTKTNQKEGGEVQKNPQEKNQQESMETNKNLTPPPPPPQFREEETKQNSNKIPEEFKKNFGGDLKELQEIQQKFEKSGIEFSQAEDEKKTAGVEINNQKQPEQSRS